MSLINTAIKPFNATAYKNGEFVEISEKEMQGKWSVVFFYPADFTFVCPTELGDLADNYAEFQKMGVEIYSVSTDTHFTHKAWHDSSDEIKKIQYGKSLQNNGLSQRARTLTTPPFSPIFITPSHNDKTPVNPSDISNAVFAELNVEFIIAGNVEISPININFTKAMTKAMTKKAIQI